MKQIGLEAGPVSQWLYEGLTKAGFDVVLLETRHVKAALSAMIIKTDRKDARGIAQLLRMGWYRSVHSKSPGSQDVRALLVAVTIYDVSIYGSVATYIETMIVLATHSASSDSEKRVWEMRISLPHDM